MTPKELKDDEDFQLGKSYFDKKDYKEGLKLFLLADKKYPNNYNVLFKIGDCKIEIGVADGNLTLIKEGLFYVEDAKAIYDNIPDKLPHDAAIARIKKTNELIDELEKKLKEKEDAIKNQQ